MRNFSDLSNKFIGEWRALVFQWRRTRGEWKDGTALDFERRIWSEFENSIPRFLKEMETLNELIDKKEREMDHLLSDIK